VQRKAFCCQPGAKSIQVVLKMSLKSGVLKQWPGRRFTVPSHWGFDKL
jgi:hypothetical protein